MPVARTIPAPAATDRFTYTLKINDDEVGQQYHVTQIEVHKEINKIPFARLTIADGNPSEETFAVSNEDLFIPGHTVEIKLGYHSEETTVFKGVIMAISNEISSSSSRLLIDCKDAAVKMTVGKNSKHYNDVSDKDIAEEIISRYSGLESAVADTSITHNDLVQFDVSDWDFIVSRMDSIGMLCLVSDGVFKIQMPDLGAEKKLDVLYGATILDYRAEIDARNQYKSVQAISRDFSSQELVQLEAREPGWNEGGNLTADSLADATGLEAYTLKHSGKLAQEELQALADAKLMKSRLSKVRGTVTYIGNADVLPGDFIGLNGVGERFSGKAIVNSVTHNCTNNVWTTEVHFGLSPEWHAEKISTGSANALPHVQGIQGLQVGIVVDNEDPAGEYRVRVKLPMVSPDEEGIWARVATLDAGKNRGSFFRPEIGDEVIVGFINGDPTHAIVLGMLHSSANAAPFSGSNDNHEKGYVSREQMKMVFNDNEKSIKIETPGGNKIFISDQDSTIVIEDKNGNKVTMEQTGVTIESATKMKLKAGADLTIEAVNITLSPSASFAVGAGGAEIKVGSGSASVSAPSLKLAGSGVTEITGGLVKIN